MYRAGWLIRHASACRLIGKHAGSKPVRIYLSQISDAYRRDYQKEKPLETKGLFFGGDGGIRTLDAVFGHILP